MSGQRRKVRTMCGHGVLSSNSRMLCSCGGCRPPDVRDTLAMMSSVIEIITEWPPIPKIDEPGQSVRSCLMMGLRSAAVVGSEELRVRIGTPVQRSSYDQSIPDMPPMIHFVRGSRVTIYFLR